MSRFEALVVNRDVGVAPTTTFVVAFFIASKTGTLYN